MNCFHRLESAKMTQEKKVSGAARRGCRGKAVHSDGVRLSNNARGADSDQSTTRLPVAVTIGARISGMPPGCGESGVHL